MINKFLHFYPPYNSKAFTMIELVLTIAILGILAVSAGVISPDINPARLHAASRQVQSDIEYAKQNAMMTGVTSGATFTAASSYTVYQSTSATPLKSPLDRQNMTITLSSKYTNVVIQTNYTVEFNSFGAPTTGGGSFVTLSDGSNTTSIGVDSNGRVSVY